MTLKVLCWIWRNRLDESGGAGYSVHPDHDSSQLWSKDDGLVGNLRIPDYSGIARYYVCGEGEIKEVTQELLTALGDQDGLFVNDKPEGFVLLKGDDPW